MTDTYWFAVIVFTLIVALSVLTGINDWLTAKARERRDAVRRANHYHDRQQGRSWR